MNKDQVKGRMQQAVGKAKEVAGDATDNSKLQAKGIAQQAKGKAQANYGDAKNSVAKKIDR
ncbi:MAG: CsbD family protein [Pseudomonadota bacterium]